MQLSHSYAIRCRAITVGIFTIRGDQRCEEIRYELWAPDLYYTLHTMSLLCHIVAVALTPHSSLSLISTCNEAVTAPAGMKVSLVKNFPEQSPPQPGPSIHSLHSGGLSLTLSPASFMLEVLEVVEVLEGM